MENNNMHDDEFRVLGTGSPVPAVNPDEERRRRKLGGWIALALVTLIGLAMILFWPKPQPKENVEGIFESSYETVAIKALGSEAALSPYAERLDTVVTGHPLTLYIPHHATPRLFVGNPDEEARQAVMAFQAADIRADNREILGDFVLAGQRLSRGISKKGFCAIIDGKVTIGIGEDTPFLAEAISRGGSFFRQYALVDEGTPVENNPKNKTIRKALCERAGQVFVVVSANDETIQDFSKALANLGVDNAIYLVGSDMAFGWTVDEAGNREQFGKDDHRPEFRNESYILWN